MVSKHTSLMLFAEVTLKKCSTHAVINSSTMPNVIVSVRISLLMPKLNQ